MDSHIAYHERITRQGHRFFRLARPRSLYQSTDRSTPLKPPCLLDWFELDSHAQCLGSIAGQSSIVFAVSELKATLPHIWRPLTPSDLQPCCTHAHGSIGAPSHASYSGCDPVSRQLPAATLEPIAAFCTKFGQHQPSRDLLVLLVELSGKLFCSSGAGFMS